MTKLELLEFIRITKEFNRKGKDSISRLLSTYIEKIKSTEENHNEILIRMDGKWDVIQEDKSLYIMPKKDNLKNKMNE